MMLGECIKKQSVQFTAQPDQQLCRNSLAWGGSGIPYASCCCSIIWLYVLYFWISLWFLSLFVPSFGWVFYWYGLFPVNLLTIILAFLMYLFFFNLSWVFVAACGLSLVVASGGYSLLRCAGFSLQWLLLLWTADSTDMSFNCCGMQALKLGYSCGCILAGTSTGAGTPLSHDWLLSWEPSKNLFFSMWFLQQCS